MTDEVGALKSHFIHPFGYLCGGLLEEESS
jgi:hypothetical protein